MPFRPHWINKKYFLVRINREEQKKKRETLGSGLLVADYKNSFMQNNMQHGEIVMIGDDSTNWLEEAKEGDTLIFSHFIEGSMESFDNKAQAALNNEYLMAEDETFNYYMVPKEEVYGVGKSDGNIFPAPNIIFAFFHKDELANSDLEKKNGLFLFSTYKDSEDQIQNEIDDLKKTLQATTNKDAQARLMMDMEALTNRVNAMRFAKFHPIFVHKDFHRNCGRKITAQDVIYCLVKGANNVQIRPYELKFKGTTYCIIKDQNVVMFTKDEPLTLRQAILAVNSQGAIPSPAL
jgi:co-chaperonin GroES (HSP10)